MADEPIGSSSRTWMLIVALVLVVVIAWMLISRSGESEPAYGAGVTDVGGGELIVTDPAETGVPVDLPETPMTNVPADQPTPEPAPPPAE